MCLLLCCLFFNICECGFQRGKVVLSPAPFLLEEAR